MDTGLPVRPRSVAAWFLFTTLLAVPAARPAAVAGPARPVDGAPDLILVHGKVFTAEPDASWAEAVAIRGNRIEAVGSDERIERMAGPKTRRVDLQSHVLLPGLTDAHVHPWPTYPRVLLHIDPGAGQHGPQASLDPPMDAVEHALKAAVAKAPAGKLIAGGIGPRVLDHAGADRDWLDRLAPHNPVMLWGFTGHGLIVNTPALRLLDIAPGAPNPPGGAYGRVGDTQRLDGHIYEYGIWNADRVLFGKLPTSALVDAYRRFASQKAAWGITLVQSMGTMVPTDRLVAALDRADPPIRFEIYRLYLPRHDVAESWAAPFPTPHSPHVRILGAKWILDGTQVERGAYLREPYSDRPGWRGHLNWSPRDIRRILAHSLDTGMPVALHVAGDGTAAVVFAQMRSLAPASVWRARRLVRIEHGDGLAPDLLRQAAELGTPVTQNPVHLSFPGMMRERYGAERVATAQPLQSILKAGIHLALGSDENMQPIANPWLNIMLAVTDPIHPDDALTRTQAIMAYTAGGAYVSHEEGRRGRIAPGMLADLAVLSADPFTVPVPQLPGIRSELTLVGGRIIYDSGALTGKSLASR
ncbi:MAG TPA: amidohydrolase [Dyella sp.]|nr:amidohydrolase [Dyella sp.]